MAGQKSTRNLTELEVADLAVRANLELHGVEMEMVGRDGTGFLVLLAGGAVIDLVLGLIRAHAKLTGDLLTEGSA